MRTTTISDRDGVEFAHGRVPARPDLDSLADLLTAYRSAAIGSAPRPSAALSARLDPSATHIVMQRDAVTEGGSTGAGARRAASGLLGLGVTVGIILAAASGAAAVVGAGSAGLLPPGAQDAFDQVVSAFAPPGVVGQETSEQGEAPGNSTNADDSVENEHGAADPKQVKTTESDKSGTNSGNGMGNGNSGNGNGSSSDSADTSPGNSGSSNGNSGNGNSGNGNGNSSGSDDSTVTSPGDGGSSNGNSGNGNGNSGDRKSDNP